MVQFPLDAREQARLRARIDAGLQEEHQERSATGPDMVGRTG
jgi:hypothetical protein